MPRLPSPTPDAYAAAAVSDPGRACALLAFETASRLADEDGSGCPAALRQTRPDRAGPVQKVHVAGDAAQVVFAGQTVFLAKFEAGWRVTAAGCARRSADTATPYTCSVEGP